MTTTNHDESKTRTHRFSKLLDDGDPWAPNNLLKSGAKAKITGRLPAEHFLLSLNDSSIGSA